MLHGNCVESIPADHPAIVALLRAGARGAAGAAGARPPKGTQQGPRERRRAASSSPAYVLISTRHQDTIAIVDWRNKALLWAWGQGELSGPHDPTMLPDGHILLFDNGLARGWSRVLEVDPVSRKILWEYRDREGGAFFSASRGSAQRLEGGNTLIAESDRGRAFEVTPQRRDRLGVQESVQERQGGAGDDHPDPPPPAGVRRADRPGKGARAAGGSSPRHRRPEPGLRAPPGPTGAS